MYRIRRSDDRIWWDTEDHKSGSGAVAGLAEYYAVNGNYEDPLEPEYCIQGRAGEVLLVA